MTPHDPNGLKQLVQLTPAPPGWYALYGEWVSDGDGGDKADVHARVPVASWALVEGDDGQRWVVGVNMFGKGGAGDPCDEEQVGGHGFLDYAYLAEKHRPDGYSPAED
jgi:hypothetical protein